MKISFQIPPLATGILVAGLVACVVIGGAKRIYSAASLIVPFMSIMYLVGACFILYHYIDHIPKALLQIITYAFKPAPAAGGFLGASVSTALRLGFARGVFSNEAGMGSAPIAHAAAETDSPVRQGLWGIFEVFADTIVACTLTALVILVTGVWDSGYSGAALTVMAFHSKMGSMGGSFVSISILFFAFASILSWSYYGDKCLEYISGGRFSNLYKFIFILVIVIGSISQLDLVWNISDTLNGLMCIPNIIAIILLSRVVIQTTNRDLKYIKNSGR